MSFHLCRNCLLPSTKPDLTFDENQVCSACTRYENRPSIDWDLRLAELKQLISSVDKTGQWDCVVPVSGGKDSTYQALIARELGLNPLLVTSNTCDLTNIGRANIDNLISLGFDHIHVSPRKDVRRKLNLFGLEHVGDISWPEHVAMFTIPVRVAVNFKIPLIIWGENSQDEYGAGTDSASKSRILDRQWLEEYGGMNGLRVSDVVSMLDLKLDEVQPYIYPDAEEIKAVGIRSIFLGSFVPWDGLSNSLIAKAYGLQTYSGLVEGSVVDYENLDNHQNGIHDYFKYLKFGFSRASDILSILVRRKVISRKLALDLVAKHERKCFPANHLGKTLMEILDPLSLTEEKFIELCDLHTNPDLFKTNSDGSFVKYEDGTPIMRDEIAAAYNS